MKELFNDMKELESALVAFRRDLHRIPEAGLEEFKTADYICSVLDREDIEYSREETAIIALIRGESESPCIALRADIDGLPIKEETGLAFSSTHEGMMHACGHDGHTAIALTAALWLEKHKNELKGTVKIFFQPAEETVGGAGIMVQKGALKNPKVDRIFGLHLMPYMAPGRIEVKKGALNGSSTSIKITVKGKGGHGAYPETAVDAIHIAAQVISGAHTLVSRRVSPLDRAVISFGVIEGGQAGNIIAEEVQIRGTMRTSSNETRDRLIAELQALVEHTAKAHGAEGILDYSYSYPALINNDKETERISRMGARLLGEENVLTREHPSMGVEDFSYFLKETVGAFYHLGCRPSSGEEAPLHSPRFDMDESALIYGAVMQTSLVLDAMEELSKEG